MNEYISKEFMLKNLEDDKMNNAEHCKPVTIQIMERFIRYVKEFPAADIQPVKHGRWIWDNSPEFGNPYGSYKCSECNERQSFKENYCPNCGAKMDDDDTYD